MSLKDWTGDAFKQLHFHSLIPERNKERISKTTLTETFKKRLEVVWNSD